MPKRYQEAIRYLYGLAGSRGIRLDLSRMERAAALRGDPQRAFRTIHVAGTNGKGSVSAMLAEMLMTAGYKTGLYTSPHLHRYVERIRIDGKPVAEAALADRVAELREAFEGKEGLALTFFEMTTLLAFECFRAAGCEVAVVEVGMGGRLDATNIIAPDVSVITRIALDHTKILGSTVRRIAGEKAGIIKPGVPVVIGSRHEVARKTIVRRAREVGAPAHLIGRDFEPINGGRSLSVRAGRTLLADLKVRLSGVHQHDNAACAVTAALLLRERGVQMPDSVIRGALGRVRWPARLEQLRGTRPAILLDAAHNPDGCVALARYLASLRKRKTVLLFGVLNDKDHARMLQAFDGLVDRRIYCTPPIRRGLPAKYLRRVRDGRVARSVRDGLVRARRAAGPDGLVVVAGSIFVVGLARALVKGIREDPPIAM